MTNKHISIIVAVGKNNEIGFQNKLLWNLPDDMKFFKEKTTGHTVIMGRNTYLSLPKGALPKRRNIVITDNKDEIYPNCIMANSIEEAIELADEKGENFVMGGASVYQQFFPHSRTLYYTQVNDSPEADTFFPEVSDTEWNLASSTIHPKDEKHTVAFTFLKFERK